MEDLQYRQQEEHSSKILYIFSLVTVKHFHSWHQHFASLKDRHSGVVNYLMLAVSQCNAFSCFSHRRKILKERICFILIHLLLYLSRYKYQQTYDSYTFITYRVTVFKTVFLRFIFWLFYRQ